MHIVVIPKLIKGPLLMLEHASQPIWAEVRAMKLDALLRLVFIVKWLRGELDLE